MSSTASCPYLQVLWSTLPTDYVPPISSIFQTSQSRDSIDRLLRFACGGECPSDASERTREEWGDKQGNAKEAFQNLIEGSREGKRKRDEVGDSSPEPKRAKVATPTAAEPSALIVDEDPPIYTLHSISTSSPLRKKLDITIHECSLRLAHPSTSISLSRSCVQRAFLLPTRGKSKPHWTVVLLTNEVPDATKISHHKSNSSATPQNTQVIFGIDALPAAAFATTSYSATDAPSKQTHPKSTPTLPVLRSFLAHLGVQAHEPSAKVFKSACPDLATSSASTAQAGTPSLTAYLGAKPGTLYFFDDGLLWGETKPFQYWALEDLATMEDDDSLRGGVRVVWAGGRMCTIVLTRKAGAPEGKEEDEEEEETHLGMVDAKEREGIEEWVRKYKRYFGKGRADAGKGKSRAVVGSGSTEKETNTEGNGVDPDLDDNDDEEDEDFVDEDESDGGSASSSSDSEGEGGGSDQEEDANDSEEGGEDEGSEEGDDMDPSKHPLLRLGAVPKMSRGVMDMVAGIIEEDFLGVSNEGGSGGGGQGSDEEDELD